MKMSLEELNQLKTDFVATVSHELRTPLTAIKGSISLVLGGITGPLSEETRKMLEISAQNTDRLLRLINDILDIAKIEAGAVQMHFERHSIVEAVDHVVFQLQSLAKWSGVTLVWQNPDQSPVIVMDRHRIEQVITNLVSNAIKFTNECGRILVYLEMNAVEVIVHVEDTGIGIPEEFHERVFEKFQQAEHSDNKAKEGTGLGLAIASAIVQEHEGKIWMKSKVGVGSRFSFSIPWNGRDVSESDLAA